MPNENALIKQEIIARTIESDQLAVAEQLRKTFKHNPENNLASNMLKILLSCVARGDFKTRSSLLKDDQLSAPSAQLTVADYVSHASRIILDYRELSAANKLELLAFFPQPGGNNVISRSATHAVIRKGADVVELKGFLLGLNGQLPSSVKTLYDFGANIAMGGEGQTNFVGKRITENGYNGHMYYHHYTHHELLMAGLEQSAPSTSLLEMFWHSSPSQDGIQHGTDQFDQGHSLVGASDTYTAAGSLYFSDPVYQAKLLIEKNSVTPDKYGSMQVRLTNEDWVNIKIYLAELNQNVRESDEQTIAQLMQVPRTARKEPQVIGSYVGLDFQTYLKRAFLLLGNDAQLIAQHAPLQRELLQHIKALQVGNTNQYPQFTYLFISSLLNVFNCYFRGNWR